MRTRRHTNRAREVLMHVPHKDMQAAQMRASPSAQRRDRPWRPQTRHTLREQPADTWRACKLSITCIHTYVRAYRRASLSIFLCIYPYIHIHTYTRAEHVRESCRRRDGGGDAHGRRAIRLRQGLSVVRPCVCVCVCVCSSVIRDVHSSATYTHYSPGAMSSTIARSCLCTP